MTAAVRDALSAGTAGQIPIYLTYAAPFAGAAVVFEVKVNSIKTSDYPTKADRPLNSKMSKSSLVENDFNELPDWKDAIDRFNEELKLIGEECNI